MASYRKYGKAMGYKDRVIIFCFAGRQPNMELQLPFIRRILEQHPNVEYHCWNFAGDCGIGGGRRNSDRTYVETISGQGIKVINDFGPMKHNEAYNHYGQPEYKDCLFIKIDDDVVFLETARFGVFLDTIDAYRGSAVTANIIHNGACTPIQPGIWELFQQMGVGLLDVHDYSDFAERAHGYFFEHWAEIVNQPIELIPTLDWLSINIVGFDWSTLQYVLSTIGKLHPDYLAGRQMRVPNPVAGRSARHEKWPFGKVFGDEGVFQTLHRIIVKGFTAAHLTYGPQKSSADQQDRWRKGYREIGEKYLISTTNSNGEYRIPELSEVSCGGPRDP